MDNNYITISELSKYLKSKFDEDLLLRKVYLKGEISNFKAHTRGHYYFTLKDETSRISAIMFASNTRSLKFLPTDGMRVLVTGRISIYEATGGYQIYVDDMLEEITGQKPKYYRSPGGNQNDTVLSTIQKPCILWNVDTRDWESRDTEKIISKTLKEVDDGDIILMHEIYKTTLDAVEPIIIKLKEKGYNFVTVTELYKIKGIPLENGKIYYGM